MKQSRAQDPLEMINAVRLQGSLRPDFATHSMGGIAFPEARVRHSGRTYMTSEDGAGNLLTVFGPKR